MKRRSLSVAAITVFGSTLVQAQDTSAAKDHPINGAEDTRPATHRGSWAFGTGIGLANLRYGVDMNDVSRKVADYEVQLAPNLSYFVGDRWMISGSVIGNLQQAPDLYGGRLRTLSAGVGLGARYYFGRATDSRGDLRKLRLFAEAGASYMRTWQAYMRPAQEAFRSQYSSSVLSAGVGASYFVLPNAALDFGLNYQRSVPINHGPSASGRLQIQFGGRIFLNRK